MSRPEEMINIARKNLPEKIKVIKTSDERLSTLGEYDVIVSLMVFQFIENIENILSKLVQNLNSDGSIIFAVFNPEYIDLCLNRNIIFRKDGNESIIMNLEKDIEIPVYLGSAGVYTELMKKLGLVKNFEIYPPFTEDFIEKYKPQFPTEIPEYMIMGFRKK